MYEMNAGDPRREVAEVRRVLNFCLSEQSYVTFVNCFTSQRRFISEHLSYDIALLNIKSVSYFSFCYQGTPKSLKH